MPQSGKDPHGDLLEVREVTKEFPGLTALKSVSLSVRAGEIHGLCGENGAGKSTLMKILCGVYPWGSYRGTVAFDGEPVRFASIKDAEKRGIRVIFQELALVRQMTVAENIYLGSEPVAFGAINWNRLYRDAAALLAACQMDVPVDVPVGRLGIGHQQMVEIAKALAGRVKLLILDEPTSALTQGEVDSLMSLLSGLRGRGVSCIYISHKLEELFRIADRITVLRDGKVIGTRLSSEADEKTIVAMMVGRELTGRFPPRTRRPTDVILAVRDWTVAEGGPSGKVVTEGVSFDLRRGEILGIAGLMGSGRTELLESLFGEYGVRRSGEMRLAGRPVQVRSAREAIDHGIALVPEDRRVGGLILSHSVRSNVTLPYLEKISRGQVIDRNRELVVALEAVRKLAVRTSSIDNAVANLSGGNQQKVVLAKWLITDPKILILDEPTRGIDVGTKYEIYRLMDELASQGIGIIMVSSELPEVLGMADRIAVMHEGRLVAVLPADRTDMEELMMLAAMGRSDLRDPRREGGGQDEGPQSSIG
jgi:D-xylose transport system ATP-binding protein